MILGLFFQPPKSAMKTRKRAKSSHWVTSKPLVDSEDEEDVGIQPFLGGVLDDILPRLSNSSRSPQVLTKKPFCPATVIASSHPAVIEPSQPTPKSPVEAPPVINGGDILIPGQVSLHQAKVALHNSVGQEDWESVYVMRPLHNKEGQVHPSDYGYPAKMCSWVLYHPEHKIQDALQGSLQSSPYLPIQGLDLQSVLWQVWNSRCHGYDNPQDLDMWLQQDHHCCQGTRTSLLSLSSAVPAAALNLPMPDLHAMAIVIWDGTAHIAILEAHVAEQDGKIDTLQCLHEGLRHKIINQHPTFPLPEPLANATSLLLDQSVPMSMSPSTSALPPLIDLSIGEMMPTPSKFEDASAIEGLLFEYNQVVQPEVPDMSGKIVDPGDPGNLVPEYDSSNDMDVEVKVEASSEEVDMAT
ncbi:uncharacterized protein BJ212DRAFT_1487073 [Suillus subaureus]|uniref:Uncharacterized protein n=1 Tax=Suillus subaureus TaxID=48587 RepID=A0A9P7J578_9AGAM|nr:uncharacterized protein BJ212DRAFT_1487073 [Suillus subaureus]KAG1803283.1 hypothetical protein BJ212DRAFT_1487073 [Suillus subaureus]